MSEEETFDEAEDLSEGHMMEFTEEVSEEEIKPVPIVPKIPISTQKTTVELYSALSKLSARNKERKEQKANSIDILQQLGLEDDEKKKRKKRPHRSSLKKNDTKRVAKVLKQGTSKSLEEWESSKEKPVVESRGFLCYVENSSAPAESTKPDWLQELREEWVKVDPFSEEAVRSTVFNECAEVTAKRDDTLNFLKYQLPPGLLLSISSTIEGSNLKTFCVNSFVLGDASFGTIATIVESCPIEVLKVIGKNNGSHNSRNTITTVGIKHLCDGIRESKTLRQLDLSHNEFEASIIEELLNTLGTSTLLEKLDLSYNQLSGDFANQMRVCLQRNTTIKTLKLLGNKFTPDHILTILDGLKNNRSLSKFVAYSKNSLSSKNMSTVANIVHFNGILVQCDLCSGKSGNPSQDKKLKSFLTENLLEAKRAVAAIRPITSTFGKSNRIDFTDCELHEISWNYALTVLNEFLLGSNKLTTVFSNISSLEHLHILHLQDNCLSTLPDEITSLKELKVLNMSNNQFKIFPIQICQLEMLEYLICSRNSLESIPNSLKNLTNLRLVDFSYNAIKTISLFPAESLQSLYLAHNQITEIPPSIGSLSELCFFDISHNKLDALPRSITKLSHIINFSYSGNTLTSIPRGIRSQGTKSLFSYLSSDGEVVSIIKLFLMGPPGSGKTSLSESLFGKSSSSSSGSGSSSGTGSIHSSGGGGGESIFGTPRRKGSGTNSLKRKEVKTKDSNVRLTQSQSKLEDITFDIWSFKGDLGGISSTYQFFSGDNSVYVIPFHITEHTVDIDAWIVSIAHKVTSNPIFVVATFTDVKSIEKEYITELLTCLSDRYRNRFPNITYFSASNVGKKRGIKELRLMLCEIIKQRGVAEQKVPNTHLLTKKLDKYMLFSPDPVMTWNTFSAMGTSLSISPALMKEAAAFYQRASKMVMFDSNNEQLLSTIFLHPQWMIDAFNKIKKYQPVLIRSGQLLQRDVETIWTAPSFPPVYHSLLLSLFEHLQIIIPLSTNNSKPQAYLVPSFLEKERPESVRLFWPTFEDKVRNISRIWEFTHLPESFFPKLVTRTSHLPVNIDSFWVTGMTLSANDNKALFEYNPTQFRLTVKLRLVRERTANNFASLLISSLNTFIEGWYSNQLTKVLLPCSHCIAEHSFDPFIFSLSDCELCAARGKRYALCRGIRPVRIDLLAPDVAMADVVHLDRKSIEMGEELGEGSFARVYKAKYKGDVVAVKIIKFDDTEELGRVDDPNEQLRERFVEFRREVSLMSGLDHINLVELKGLCVDASEMLMITEFLACGDLYNFLHSDAHMSWALRFKIAFDIASGMKFLHNTTPPIIHRDLKTPNILLAAIKPTARVCAKVADFGLSSTLVHTVSGRDVFNPTWLAPEVMIPGAEYTEKADVYSYGIVLWELVTRKNPFDEFNIQFSSQLENQIIEDNLRPTIPKSTDKPFAKLIQLCWDADPDKRPIFTDIVAALKRMQPNLSSSLRGTMSVQDLRAKLKTQNNTLRKGALNDSNSVPVAPKEEMSKYMAVAHQTLSPLHHGSVKCMTLVGDHVWVGCGDGSVYVWATSAKQFVQELAYPLKSGDEEVKCSVNAIARVSPDCVWVSYESLLGIWNTKKSQMTKKVKNIYLALLVTTKYVWCATTDGPYAIHVRNIDGRKLKKTIPFGDTPCGCMLEVDNTVWTGTFQNIVVYNSKDFTKINEFQGHEGMIHDLIEHEQKIWSCSSDKTIRVWDKSGQCLSVLEGHGSRVFQLLSHKNKIFSASWDKTIMIWEPSTTSFLQELINIHEDAISCLLSVPAGSRIKKELWSGSWDKSISVSVVKTAKFSNSGNQTGMDSNEDILQELHSLGASVAITALPNTTNLEKMRTSRFNLTRKRKKQSCTE